MTHSIPRKREFEVGPFVVHTSQFKAVPLGTPAFALLWVKHEDGELEELETPSVILYEGYCADCIDYRLIYKSVSRHLSDDSLLIESLGWENIDGLSECSCEDDDEPDQEGSESR